jgi:imidazolonepropionase-like amidohydrolase
MRYLPIDSRRSISLAAAIATILIIGAASAADAPAPAAPAVTALQCGHLIDTANGKLLGATTIVIEGGRIKEVSNGVQSPAGAKTIDLSTQTCMPGLIDAHTHLTEQTSRTQYVDQFHWNIADYAVRSTVYARRTLLAGFTTVRNLGDVANESVALRNAINAGVIPGPRI